MNSPQNIAFFKQFGLLVPKPQVKYLMCYWARPENRWQELFERDTARIINQTKQQVITELVDSPNDLFQKLPDFDGLYVAGGEAEPLEKQYPQLNDLKNHLKGKVYFGNSMGAFMAAKNYVLSLASQDDNTVHQGLGMISINILCHWNVETNKEMKLDLFSKQEPQTPIVTLNEEEFVTLYMP